MAASLLSERCSLFLCCFFCFVTYLIYILRLAPFFNKTFLFLPIAFPVLFIGKISRILFSLLPLFLHTLRHRHHIAFSKFDIVSDSTYYIPPTAKEGEKCISGWKLRNRRMGVYFCVWNAGL